MSPMAIILTTFTGCFVGSLVPVVNTEVVVLAAAAVAPRSLLLPLVVVAASTQMMAKTLLYCAGAGLVQLPAAASSARFRDALRRAQQMQNAGSGMLFFSAATGFPPFYLVSVASGALKLDFRRFLILGFIGRLLRFSVVVVVPQLIHRVLL